MDGYEINFSEAQKAAQQLTDILEEFSKLIQQLSTNEEQMLNDALWYGPNKADFSRKFEEYKTAVNNLYKNAAEHLTALNEVIGTYSAAESR